MKLGITTNVFAGPLKAHEVELEGILAWAGENGFRALEIRDESASLGEPRVRSLVSAAQKKGLTLSYGIKNDLLGAGDASLFERAVGLTSICGDGAVLRMLASQEALKAEGKLGYAQEDVESITRVLTEYGRTAERQGVVLAIENARDPLYGRSGFHGIGELISGVSSENVGLTFDPANATNASLCKAPSGQTEVLRFVDEFGKRIRMVHFKTTRGGVGQSTIGEADVDSDELLERLSRVYDGVLCIEIPGAPGLTETKAAVEASLDYLRTKVPSFKELVS